MEKLNPNFADFLRLLTKHGVDYVVVGGYAVGFHGYVRATGDLDVFVRTSDSTAERLVGAFVEFGFVSPELRSEPFLVPGNIVRIGLPPLRIEVMNAISGVEFSECFAARVRAEIDGLEVPLLGREELLRNQRASGRPKDLADIAGLIPPS